jgi:hypothetical protein
MAILLLTVSNFSVFVSHADAFLWGRGRKTKLTQTSCMDEAVLKAKGQGRCRDISEEGTQTASLAIFQCLEQRYGRKDMRQCNLQILRSFQKCLSAENADDNVLTHIELLKRRVIAMCLLIHDSDVSRYIGQTTQDLRANLDELENIRKHSRIPIAVKRKCNSIYNVGVEVKNDSKLELREVQSNAKKIKSMRVSIEKELDIIRNIEKQSKIGLSEGLSHVESARIMLRDALPRDISCNDCPSDNGFLLIAGLLCHAAGLILMCHGRHSQGQSFSVHSNVKRLHISTPQHSARTVNWPGSRYFSLTSLLLLDTCLTIRNKFARSYANDEILALRMASLAIFILSSGLQWIQSMLARRPGKCNRYGRASAVFYESSSPEE